MLWSGMQKPEVSAVITSLPELAESPDLVLEVKTFRIAHEIYSGTLGSVLLGLPPLGCPLLLLLLLLLLPPPKLARPSVRAYAEPGRV